MSILEMIIVLVCLTIGTQTYIEGQISVYRGQILMAEGQNEAVINNAFAEYQTQNQAALLAGTGVSGFANPMTPTVAELAANKYLKAAYSPTSFWKATYVMQISIVPAGCSVAAGTCHLSSVFYPSTPLTRKGRADVEGAGEVVSAAGALFGFSNYQSPGTISGLNGQWSQANPLAGSPAASILGLNGYGTDGGSVYIRRDGGVTWTGSQNVNNVSLYNVNDVATQTIHASSTVQGGNIVSSTTLQAGNVASPETACTQNGATAGDVDGSGLQMTCLNHLWVPTAGRWQLINVYAVANGSVVPAPACSYGGAPRMFVAAQNFYVDSTATVNFGPASGSGPWTINLVDGNGTPIPGQGQAMTYCVY